MSEQTLSRRIVIFVAVAALAIVGCGVLWVTYQVRNSRAEIREYQEAHSDAKIVGKRASEIIAMYGEPYAGERGSDGEYVFIMYKQVKQGQYCGIVIKDGVAAEVSFWGQ